MTRALRDALLFILAAGLAPGCFGGDTEIVTGDPGGGGAGGGGSGGGGDLADDACDLDLALDTLEGWEAAGDRWAVRDGRLAAVAAGEGGGTSGLVLRGADEACTDFEASVTFTPAPGAYPILAGRVDGDGAWYGVGYDGRYGVLVLLTGRGAETGEPVAPLQFVDLDPGVEYRLTLRVVDAGLLGALSEADGKRPLAVAWGPGPERPGPGRIGLLESTGGAVTFGRLQAAPIVRDAEGTPRLESARVVAPDTLLVTTAPRAAQPLEIAGAPAGLTLRAGGDPMAITAVEPRPGAPTELVVTADAFLRGADDVTLAHDGGGAIGRDGAPLEAFEAAALSLLHDDTGFEPFADDFDGERLGPGWVATPPEAFSVGRGVLTTAPRGDYGERGFLRRPMAERHVDARVVADFTFDPEPRRGVEWVQAGAMLRARSRSAQYQAAFLYGDFEAALVLRLVGRDGLVEELARVPVPRDEAAPGAPLRLSFDASGPLLWAALHRLDRGEPTLLASAAATDDRLPGPGPAGLLALGNGTVRFEGVRVEPVEPPPPRIAGATVPADDPRRVDVTVLAASALRGLGPEGFTVWAGERRTVRAVTAGKDGLVLRLDGPPVVAGQRVFLSYDAGAGTITDSARPSPRPLLGVDFLPVENEAPPGDVLALAHARLVTPDTLDLVVTDSGALPVRVGGAEGLEVRLAGRPVPVVAARPLVEVPAVVRVSFDGEAGPGDRIDLRYTAGRAGPVTDGAGQELRAFDAAYVENLLLRPKRPTPEADDFERPDGDDVGGGWEPRTPALWALEGGALRFTGPGDGGLDARILRPASVRPTRYRASVRVRAAPWREGFEEPVAALFGSFSRTNPDNPDDYFDLRLGVNFATGDVFLIGQYNAPVAGARLDGPVGPGRAVRLVLELNGRAATGRVEDEDGRVLATVRYFLPFAAPAGRVGFLGGPVGTVFFDDYALEAPAGRPPLTQVLGARLSAAAPSVVRVDVGTPSGRILTGGGAAGWSVTVDGRARPVDGVERSGESLLVRFGGPPAAARHAVTITYDARRGDVHDGSSPVPYPLETLPPFPVRNEAAVGGDLFVVRGETVGPWGVDLVFNDQAALPATAEPGAAGAFTVTAGGRALPVRAVTGLPGRTARLRLLLAEPVPVGAPVEVTYAPGGDGARVLDARGGELKPPFAVPVANDLTAAEDFPPFADDFEGPGINFGPGWTAEPADAWARDRGDARFERDDFREGPRLLRPAAEARADVRIVTRVNVRTSPQSFVAAGAVARVGPDRGYRGWYAATGDGLTPALRVERLGPFGGTVLGETRIPRLDPDAVYTFDFRVHGALVALEVRRDGELVGAAAGVDPGPPVPAGRVGLVAQGAGTARFADFRVEPLEGVAARVAAVRATVYNHSPDTIAVDVAAAERLLFADGRGFAVTVNGRPRAVESVALAPRRVLVTSGGDPIAPDDAVSVSFDPAAGLVVDDSAVPQPLGPVDDLRAGYVDQPLLAATTVAGANIVELTFDLAPERLPLVVEGDGGLQLWVAHPDLGDAPVRLGLVDVWVDPAGSGDTLLLAASEPIPPGAEVTIVWAPAPGDRLADVEGVEPAAFDLPAVAPAARATADLDPPGVYEAAWSADGEGAGWRIYAARPDRWIEGDGELLALGSGVFDATTEAIAPPFTAAGDVRVSVDFQIADDDAPLGRFAFPRVVVRGLNARSWVGCYIRNELGLLPAFGPGGRFDAVDPLGPALNCAARPGDGDRVYFDACRMQFYDLGPNGEGRVRYDWAAHWRDRHRLVVKVLGPRLRAELYNLELRRGGELVAVVEVPDIGEAAPLGMVGLGTFDSGRVRFTNFRAEPATPDDFPPLDDRWAPTGGEACRP